MSYLDLYKKTSFETIYSRVEFFCLNIPEIDKDVSDKMLIEIHKSHACLYEEYKIITTIINFNNTISKTIDDTSIWKEYCQMVKNYHKELTSYLVNSNRC